VSDLIMDGYKRHRVDPDAARMPTLSPREREVVQLVSEGKASKEVAAILNVTLATAETHRSNILRKLKLHSIAELVLYAVRNEIVHVHFPSVLGFPNSGDERLGPASVYTPISKGWNGRRTDAAHETN
jgi:DNA-binding CsgD family transcriptional regulator